MRRFTTLAMVLMAISCVFGGETAAAVNAIAKTDAAGIAWNVTEVNEGYWKHCDRFLFDFEGMEAWVIPPKHPRPGNPWVWCCEWPTVFPERTAARAMVNDGFYFVHLKVGCECYGSPKALDQMDRFFKFLVSKGLDYKAVLTGVARGGLYAYRFAARYPDRVHGIYGDAPVCDLKSYPTYLKPSRTHFFDTNELAKVSRLYGFPNTVEALENFRGNPVDFEILEPIARARIPILHVIGNDDNTVPPADNSDILEKRYRMLGGEITVIRKPGCDHHPHGLSEIGGIMRFIQDCSGHGTIFRLPAAPLVNVDPFFSVWSTATDLNATNTSHWSWWNEQPISVRLVADGREYRLCGLDPKEIPPLRQISCSVRALSTIYRFREGSLDVTLDFTTMKDPRDLELFSRPVAYIRAEVKGAKEWHLKTEISPKLATNDDTAPMVTNVTEIAGLPAISIGRRDQTPLSMSGDAVRCNWGRVWLVGDGIPLNGSSGRATYVIGYDDEKSIRWFDRDLPAWWRRNSRTFEQMLADAVMEHDSVLRRAERFNRDLMHTFDTAHSYHYMELAMLAWRQSFGACKLVAGPDGQPFYFSKENGSGGYIGTTDVFYPQMPHLLWSSTPLVKATLEPTLTYASSGMWPYEYAPHDLGKYPLATGQQYLMTGTSWSTGKPVTDADRMPVEECGNMLICLGALATKEGNADFASRWWPTVTKWAHYLERQGFDPGSQLCTDDFAGHLAHNANLSIKTIIALACYGRMAALRGEGDVADHYDELARAMVRQWLEAAKGGKHGGYRLAFDQPDTWSMKYNLVWDRVLGLNLFPDEVRKAEIAAYLRELQPFGLPLDSRKNWTKADWQVWCAAMTDKEEDFRAIVNRLFFFACYTEQRIPLSDWYWADTGNFQAFIARSVVGAFYMPLLDFSRQIARGFDSQTSVSIDEVTPLQAPTDEEWRTKVQMLRPAGEPPVQTGAGEKVGIGNCADRKTTIDSRRDVCDTAAYYRPFVNEKPIWEAVWYYTGEGVFEPFVNGRRVDEAALKPGFTDAEKTRHVFSADVTELLDTEEGAENTLSALVTRGWWRDRILGGMSGTAELSSHQKRYPGFASVLVIRYADGSIKRLFTDTKWKAAYAGPVVSADTYYGETYDSTREGELDPEAAAKWPQAVPNDEFKGSFADLPCRPVAWREDLALVPRALTVWNGVEGAAEDRFGRIKVIRTPAVDEVIELEPGEKLVIDFGQNCSAVPEFTFSARRGTMLQARFAEMVNDGEGLKSRGNDGPGGSIYTRNLRSARAAADYVFSGRMLETYRPRYAFFGYRYLEVSADQPVRISSVRSIPVTSIHREMETGSIVTGDKSVNQLISNVRWGQYSNYLSVPTDCPQRDERLGWAADTQVFTGAAMYNADVYDFLYKWMGDMVDGQFPDGTFPVVAPRAHCEVKAPRLGWSDAGIIVPWTIWKRTGNTKVFRDYWDAMERYMTRISSDRFRTPKTEWQFGDWLQFEDVKHTGNMWAGEATDEQTLYFNFLGACYWLMDARMMAEMAATFDQIKRVRYEALVREVSDYARREFLTRDGVLKPEIGFLQTANLMALHTGILKKGSRGWDKAKKDLLRSIDEHGGCLQTGFLGTSIILNTLSEIGADDYAYTLLLQRKCPSWLYSVDQGATTIWERWNSYTKDAGFGDAGMNSFNHYAYGAVLDWLYQYAAGIRPIEGGFRKFRLDPHPDRRLGKVDCVYKSDQGEIRSSWEFLPSGCWHWSFTIPDGAEAMVSAPGERPKRYGAGTYRICR